MKIILKLCGAPSGPTPWDGQYLRDFDFEANEGRGMITMTSRESEAKTFETAQEAVAYLTTQPTCAPLREDGEPNRPLTATHWALNLVSEEPK